MLYVFRKRQSISLALSFAISKAFIRSSRRQARRPFPLASLASSSALLTYSRINFCPQSLNLRTFVTP
nr:MAG TPA: hypothetical protein [Bacteriophage sp.]